MLHPKLESAKDIMLTTVLKGIHKRAHGLSKKKADSSGNFTTNYNAVDFVASAESFSLLGS